MKKILLMVGTHGNERIGLEVVSRLRLLGLDPYFDTLVANPLATVANKRLIETDLNRSYPGAKTAKKYEVQLAACNLAIARKYQYVIDMHEASAGTDDFVIIPKEKVPKQFPRAWVSLQRVLLWPDPTGPISEVLPQAFELEFGMKNRSRAAVVKRATAIVEAFIDCQRDNIKTTNTKPKSIYYVYGKLRRKDYKKSYKTWRDFRPVTVRGERFLPLLVGQYTGIVCYKMRKIS